MTKAYSVSATHALLVLAEERSDQHIPVPCERLGLISFQGMQSIQPRCHIPRGGDEVSEYQRHQKSGIPPLAFEIYD